MTLSTYKIKGFKAEKLCGNVFTDTEKSVLLDGFKAYTVKTLENGLRVAFIGVVSPNITVWDKEHLKKHYVLDAAEATRRIIDNIKKHALADVIILLGHMHTFNELGHPGSGAEEVIDTNPEIDLFLGAHFHTRIGTKGNQCILCESVKFAENLDSAKTYGRARITATFENGRWLVKNRIGSYESSDVKTHIIAIENDPAVEMATKEAHEAIKKYMSNNKIGTLTGGPLVPEPEIQGTHSAILEPTPLLHLIGSVMLKYAKTDIAAVSLNNYEANCLEGNISSGSVARMYVYDNNSIYKLKMTGKQIKQWMEWSHEFFGLTVDGKPDRSKPAVNLDEDLTIPYGARKVYLHDKFAGLNYTVDLTKPAGLRIHVLDEWFDLDTTYTVATTNYRATTNLTIHDKDGVFRDPNEDVATVVEMDVKSSKEHINMLDWIEEYIADAGGEIKNEVNPEWWRFINLNWDEKLRREAIGQINKGKIHYEYTKPIKKADLKSIKH